VDGILLWLHHASPRAPIATHNTGSQLNTYAATQWAGSIKDYARKAMRADDIDGRAARLQR